MPGRNEHPVKRPLQTTHRLGAVDFGTLGAYTADAIKVPFGYTRGTIVDVGVNTITETFACDTTPAIVRVGTTGDADFWVELEIADGTAATDAFNVDDDLDAIKLANIEPQFYANRQLEVTFVAGTDSGTVAGIATPYIIIDWE